MILWLYHLIALFSVALVMYLVRACGTTITVRRTTSLFMVAMVFVGHFVLCLLDEYDKYNGWINLFFFAVLIRIAWYIVKAKYSDFKLKVTILTVIIAVFFTLSYIMLGYLSIRHTHSMNT